MKIVAETLSADAFSPFGDVLEHGGSDRRRMFPDATAPEGEACSARLWVSRYVEPAGLPLTISTLERHPLSPQTFIPLDVSRYVVTVAPSNPAGEPSLADARAFVVGAGQGIVYRRGTWHAGMTVLDRPAQFAVLIWTTGEVSRDDEFLSLSDPIQVIEAGR